MVCSSEREEVVLGFRVLGCQAGLPGLAYSWEGAGQVPLYLPAGLRLPTLHILFVRDLLLLQTLSNISSWGAVPPEISSYRGQRSRL